MENSRIIRETCFLRLSTGINQRCLLTGINHSRDLLFTCSLVLFAGKTLFRLDLSCPSPSFPLSKYQNQSNFFINGLKSSGLIREMHLIKLSMTAMHLHKLSIDKLPSRGSLPESEFSPRSGLAPQVCALLKQEPPDIIENKFWKIPLRHTC